MVRKLARAKGVRSIGNLSCPRWQNSKLSRHPISGTQTATADLRVVNPSAGGVARVHGRASTDGKCPDDEPPKHTASAGPSQTMSCLPRNRQQQRVALCLGGGLARVEHGILALCRQRCRNGSLASVRTGLLHPAGGTAANRIADKRCRKRERPAPHERTTVAPRGILRRHRFVVRLNDQLSEP